VRQRLPVLCLLMIGLMTGSELAQSSSDSQPFPLCELQTKLAQGEQRNVRVEGVYLSGIDLRYLVTSGCSGRSTRIKFELRTHRLWNKLVRLSKGHVPGYGEPVLVVFEGEFYGPPVPDPRLPEPFRKNYHPGWDENASTKMVVHAILSVEPLPANHPCAPPRSDPRQWPCFQNPAPVSQSEGVGPAAGVSHEAGHVKGIAPPLASSKPKQ